MVSGRKAMVEDALPVLVIIIFLLFLGVILGAQFLQMKQITSAEQTELLKEMRYKAVLYDFLDSVVPGKDVTYAEFAVRSYYSSDKDEFNEFTRLSKSYFRFNSIRASQSDYGSSYAVLNVMEWDISKKRSLDSKTILLEGSGGDVVENIASGVLPSFVQGRVIIVDLQMRSPYQDLNNI